MCKLGLKTSNQMVSLLAFALPNQLTRLPLEESLEGSGQSSQATLCSHFPSRLIATHAGPDVDLCLELKRLRSPHPIKFNN